jgi:hypothetical protein
VGAAGGARPLRVHLLPAHQRPDPAAHPRRPAPSTEHHGRTRGKARLFPRPAPETSMRGLLLPAPGHRPPLPLLVCREPAEAEQRGLMIDSSSCRGEGGGEEERQSSQRLRAASSPLAGLRLAAGIYSWIGWRADGVCT